MGTTKDIREAVEAELEFDPLVDDADIHVVNINGDVALDGTVPGYPQYLEAAAAVQRVAGARTCTITCRSCCRTRTTATTRC
jgi:osmotically-inducible protein OsmY